MGEARNKSAAYHENFVGLRESRDRKENLPMRKVDASWLIRGNLFSFFVLAFISFWRLNTYFKAFSFQGRFFSL